MVGMDAPMQSCQSWQELGERTAVAAGRLGLDEWTDRVQRRILAILAVPGPGYPYCRVLAETRVANCSDRSLNVRFFRSMQLSASILCSILVRDRQDGSWKNGQTETATAVMGRVMVTVKVRSD